MKQVVVLSGKGGTGKTTVVAGLAHLASRDGSLILVDADVDAPNLELLLQPQVIAETPFYSSKVAEIAQTECLRCGDCQAICRFEAVVQNDGDYWVDPVACEGCASCYYACPGGAIQMHEHLDGQWYHSATRFGTLFHARLEAGAENSGKMVSTLRQQALFRSHEEQADWIIVDGGPGTGCPVIAAVTGADLAVLVSEPTVSGVHDLKRAMGICDHFRVPVLVCVNKCDINPAVAQEIVDYCRQRAVSVVARVPYNEIVLTSIQRSCAVTELNDNVVAREIQNLWVAVRGRLAKT
ncbi:MAG: P-loop NTPase [Chloroflexi bacterium]|nr:P-loop NTPase [Chloroflexota bacterium]